MTAILVMLLACLAAWAHVIHMLDAARDQLGDALTGDPGQARGWLPSPAPLPRRAAARALTRP